jgi:hypothetical protein
MKEGFMKEGFMKEKRFNHPLRTYPLEDPVWGRRSTFSAVPPPNWALNFG